MRRVRSTDLLSSQDENTLLPGNSSLSHQILYLFRNNIVATSLSQHHPAQGRALPHQVICTPTKSVREVMSLPLVSASRATSSTYQGLTADLLVHTRGQGLGPPRFVCACDVRTLFPPRPGASPGIAHCRTLYTTKKRIS
jgi:hypothetical protein